jgi:glycosyltransferase involved in cell wall biosynthesis
MKIAQVVASYHPRIGGLETHVRRLAHGCAEAGDDVTVLTHQVDGSPTEERIGAVRVLRFPLTLSLSNYPVSFSLFRYLRIHAADFDLVHAHSYHNLVGQAAVGSCVPFVFTPHYHGTGHTPFRAFLHRLYRPVGARLFSAADAVICVSEAERDLVTRDFPCVAGKAVTIPNGIGPQLAERDDGSRMFHEPVVLSVGRLERYKNVDLIIDAFRALPCRAILAVVGEGPDRTRLERRAQPADPAMPIIFTGRISDKALDDLLAQACVVTSASDHEAFGLTVADGLASGARVVASAIPAHVELARQAGADSPVALVDPRDTKTFAGMLSAFIRAGRVAEARPRLPSWTEVVATTRDLYAQVCVQDHPAIEAGPPDTALLPDVPRSAEQAVTESA